MDIIVEPLSNHPGAVPMVAEWHFREWGHTDPGGSLRTWTAAMARQARADEVPGTLIALHQDLYLYTERDSNAQALYKRLNWRAIHAGSYDGIAVTVMQTSLASIPRA